MQVKTFALGLTAAVALTLTGCTSEPPKAAPTPKASSVPVIVPGTPGGPNQTLTTQPPPSTPTVDPDDVTFLSDMMVHHTQAVQMSEWARGSAVNAQVKALGERIRVGQKPEIEAMRQLLTERGQTPPNLEHAHHQDHSAMPGMASPAQLTSLRNAKGKAFDKRFLELMIKHHEGALTMSRKQLDAGSDIRIGEFAQDVGSTQTKEIATMRQLLKAV